MDRSPSEAIQEESWALLDNPEALALQAGARDASHCLAVTERGPAESAPLATRKGTQGDTSVVREQPCRKKNYDELTRCEQLDFYVPTWTLYLRKFKLQHFASHRAPHPKGPIQTPRVSPDHLNNLNRGCAAPF